MEAEQCVHFWLIASIYGVLALVLPGFFPVANKLVIPTIERTKKNCPKTTSISQTTIRNNTALFEKHARKLYCVSGSREKHAGFGE